MTDYNETPIRKVIPRSNYPNNGGRPIYRDPVGAIMHHIVGTLPGCTAHFQNPATGYATNYGIGSADGRGGGEWQIHEYVPADGVAWGNGNTDPNNRGVSIEHENDLRIAINGKPRPEVHELSARFLASLARRFDWRIGGELKLVARDFPNHDFYARAVPGFGVDFNVITHRSVAKKDCPKDLDFGWIVARANVILSGAVPAKPEEEEDEITMDKVGFIYRTDTGELDGKPVDWSLVSPALPNGYVATADQATANAWALIFGAARHVKTRDEYIRAQSEALKLNRLAFPVPTA